MTENYDILIRKYIIVKNNVQNGDVSQKEYMNELEKELLKNDLMKKTLNLENKLKKDVEKRDKEEKRGGKREGSGRKNQNRKKMSITFDRNLKIIINNVEIEGHNSFSDKLNYIVNYYVKKEILKNSPPNFM